MKAIFSSVLTRALLALLTLAPAAKSQGASYSNESMMEAVRISPAYQQRRFWSATDIRSRINAITDSSVPAALKESIISDLITMSTIHGSGTPTYHRWVFHGDINGQTYVNYVLNLVEAIEFRAGKLLAAANPENNPLLFKRTMLVSDRYWTLSPMNRLHAMIHEARHLEEITPHVICADYQTSSNELRIATLKGKEKLEPPRSELANERACDETASGAYAAGVTFLSAMALSCENCTNDEREEALELAIGYLHRITASRERDRLRRALFPAEMLLAPTR